MPAVPRHLRAARLAVLALAGLYAAYFSAYTCIVHQRFKTFAYDLGTFDQGIWLAGHGTDFFVTVRGLHLLGDHVRLISFVLAPLYYIWDDVRALLVLQSVVIAAGAWFLCRIAQRELPDRPWIVLAVCAGYLLHPAVQNLNLDHAHPDAFSSTFILASIDFVRGGRLVPFWIAAGLAMACKEDVPLVFVAMGLVLMLDPQRRRLGFALAAAAGTYFVLCMTVILPHFNGVGFFRFGPGGFMAGTGTHATDPAWLLGRVVRPESAAYLLSLGVPHLFLFLLAPLWIVPAVPSLAANLLSDAQYMRNLELHYHTSIVPFLAVATIDAVARLNRRMWRRGATPATAATAAAGAGATTATRTPGAWRRFASSIGRTAAPLALLCAAVAANIGWSKVPVHRMGMLAETWGYLRNDTRIADLHRMLESIPKDAVVSADYSLVPHLSHRRRIYMFPNPFQLSNWGIQGENTHDPETVEYVAVTKKRGDLTFASVDTLLVTNGLERVAGRYEYRLYRRVLLGERASCGDWNGDGSVTGDDARWIGGAIMTHRPCPARVCDADGDGMVAYGDVLRIGKRVREPATPLACPP